MEQSVELIRKNIFSISNPIRSSRSLIGSKEQTEKIIDNLEQEFSIDGKTQNERVFYFRTPIEIQNPDLMLAQKYWNFWGALVKEFSKVISIEVLERLKVNKIETCKGCYDYFNFKIENDKRFLLAGSKLNELLDWYKENNIHIILVFTEVENILKVYPNEKKDAMFVQWLFSISIKGIADKRLSVLLVSEQKMGVFQKYLGTKTSLMEDAYPS